MRTKPLLATVVLAAALSVTGFGPARAQSSKSAEVTAKAQAIFDEYWQWVLREYPEWATQLGDHRYDDRLSDQSAAAVDRRRAARVAFRDRLAKVDATRLSPADRVSVRILRYQLDQIIALDKVCAPFSCFSFDFWSPVTQFRGPQFDLPHLAQSTRFASVRDYEAYLKRLDAWPERVEHLIVRMETGMKLGWMPARDAITRVPGQLDAQLDPDPTKSPEYKPFQTFAAGIAPADRERLSAAGQRTIREKVIPAFRRLRAFYEDTYLPAASENIAASSLPPGLPYYEARLASTTTTGMSPTEIHELGLAEVARIGKQMDEVVAVAGFKGTRAEFQNAINTDPRFLPGLNWSSQHRFDVQSVALHSMPRLAYAS